MPIVVIIVAVVALLGYLASNISSSSQRAMSAERDVGQAREQMAGLTRQITALQKDDAIAKSPGRTTIILDPAAATTGKAGKKKAAPANDTSKAWAAATWGELPDGKTFLRVNAYGLLENRESGKDFHVWFQPQSGNPVDVGALEPDQNGNGFAMNIELPAIDQGKQVMLTADAQGSKQPGDVLAKADLPRLKPTTQAAPPASGDSQAKSGSTSQQMHQGQPAGEKPAGEQAGK